MSDDLKKPETGEVPTTPAAGESGATGQGPSVSPEVQASIDAAIAKVRDEYEKAGGKIAKVQSTYDKQVAELKRQLAEARSKELKEAQAQLEAGNYEEAARGLAAQVEQLTQAQAQEAQSSELQDWVGRVMGELGKDPATDEAAAASAAEWISKIQADPDQGWDFVVTTAKARVEEERAAAERAKKEAAALTEAIPNMIKAEVAKVLTSAGLTPAPTGEGTPTGNPDAWRSLTTAELIKLGLNQRKAAPLKRIKEE